MRAAKLIFPAKGRGPGSDFLACALHLNGLGEQMGLQRIKLKHLGLLMAFALVGCEEGFRSQKVAAQAGVPGRTSTPITTTSTTTSSTTSTSLDPATDGTGGTSGVAGQQTLSCGSRQVITYVPASYRSSTPMPVVVWYHGLGDDIQNFYSVLSASGWRSLADSKGFILAVPASTNPSRASFLYFNGDQFDMNATRAEMNNVHDCVMMTIGGQFNISRSRVHWVGFSEGGSFVGLAASLKSDQLRSAMPLAGGAQILPPLLRKIPLYFIIGTSDGSFSHIQQVAAGWESAGHPVRKDFHQGLGHSVSSLMNATGIQNMWNWMAAAPPL